MKKLLSLAAVAAMILSLASCGDGGNDGPTVITPSNETLSGNITTDKTLTNDRIWEMSGKVFVTGGATLTIEPGTIIKGQPGTGTTASGLYIARDGMINAVGTSSQPIIFTSTDDNIELGQLTGTNLSITDNQLWGGVVILGNAPISPDQGTTAQIEGVPASETLGQYGGADAADDRGTMKYVSIRHGGTSIDPVEGKDINGLTLGGVGSGTSISNIEIIANYDDGIEFFGGTVNVSNILVYGVGDDALDIDQAYAGTINNFMVYTSTEGGSDEGMEVDGPEGADNAGGMFTIQNGSIISADGGGSAADFKSKAQGTITNVEWTGFSGGATLKFRASFDAANSCADKTDAYTNLVDSKTLVFSDIAFDQSQVYDGDASDACDLPGGYQTTALTVLLAAGNAATGASNTTVWDNWTLSSNLSLLN